MRRWRRWIWVAAAVVVLVAGVLWLRARSKAKEQKDDPGQVVQVERGEVRKTVSGDGVLRPLTTVEVKSYAGGKVEVMAVDIGDEVESGALIAVIDPTDSQSTHVQAQADLQVSLASLVKARANLRVQSALTAAAIAQSNAQYASAQADQARLEQATQPQTRAQARAAVDEATAGLDSARRELERIHSASQPQTRSDAKASIDKSAAALSASEEDLAKLRVSTQPQSRADAQTAFDRAVASRDSARQTLERLRASGIPQGKVQAEGGVAKARSEMELASRDLERMRSLREDQLVSQSELEAAENTYEARRVEFENARELRDTLGADQSGQVRSAELTIAQAEADIAAARKRLDTLDSQQTAETRALAAKVDQSRADLNAAQARWETLPPAEEADIRVAEAKVAQAEAALASVTERWRTIEMEQDAERASAGNKVEQTKAALDSSRTQAVEGELRKAEVAAATAQVQKSESQVRNAAIMLGYTTISAPRAGVILDRYVEQGTIVTSGRSSVSTGTTLVLLGDNSQMFVDAKVSESDLSEVRLGQDVEVTVEAYGETPVAGKVTRIDPKAVTESSVTTVKVEVEVIDPQPGLLPGLTASCDFLVEVAKDALFVPRRAVQSAPDGSSTVQKVVDGAEQETAVTIGLKGDDATVITSGLSDGDEILLPPLATANGQENRGREMGRRMGGGMLAGPR